MAQSTVGTERTIGDYGLLARRRWIALLVGLLIGLLLAVAYLNFATPTYVSNAKVLVRSVSTDTTATGSRTAETVNLDTEAQLVTSFPVADIAATTLGATGDPVRLTRKVTVTVPANTTVLNVAYAATSAQGAVDGAQAFAEAYLENRTATAVAANENEINRVRGVIKQLGKQLQAVNNELNDVINPPSALDRTGLLARRDNINVQVGAASVSLTSLQGTVITGGEIIFQAQLPHKKTSPNPVLVLPSGLMAGLLLGIALAVLRDRMDKRIHTSADVERLFGVPVLAEADASRAASLERSPNVQHEMRALYYALRAPDPRTPVVVLLVGDNDAAADELAGVFASVSARSGSLTTLIRRDSTLDDPTASLTLSSAPDLDVFDYQTLEILHGDELRPHAATAVISDLSENRDVVALGLPTGDRTIDLPALGHSVDVAVLVIELGVTRRPAISSILGDLSRTSVRQIVAIAVRQPKDLPDEARVGGSTADRSHQ